MPSVRVAVGFLLLCSAGAQEAPRRGAADKTVYTSVAELQALPRALAPQTRAEREVHPPRNYPLSRKDRWEQFPLQAISPTMARLLQLTGPQAEQTPSALAPSTPRELTGFRGGLDDVTTIPPDTHGAVGPDHVLTVLNNDYQVQRRDGTLVFRVTGDSFFDRLGPFNGSIFDPRASYDPVSRRWVVVALADAQMPATSSICLAVSQTPDPAGQWTMYRIRANSLEGLWYDYPNLAIAGDWVAVTVNLFARDTFSRSEIFVFTKQDLYTGRGEYRAFRETRGSPVPVSATVTAGRLPIVMLGVGSANQPTLIVSEVRGTPGAETFVSTALTTQNLGDPFAFAPIDDNFSPQRGSTDLIAANDARLQNCLLQGQSIWCVHHIFLPAARPERVAVQYYELSAGTLEVLQRGRVEDVSNATMYAFPSIAVNSRNDALIGFSRFRANEFASAAYAMRLATDPPGQLQADALLKAGEATYRRGASSNRWGDYSATQVDPVDNLSFWTIQEYAASTATGAPNRWGTWWGRITPRATECVFQSGPGEIAISAAGGPVALPVTATAGCGWMAAADVGWLSVAGTASYQGTQTVTLNAALNPLTVPRSATVTVAGRAITINQAANASPPPTRLAVTSVFVTETAQVGESLFLSAGIANRSAVPSGRFRIGFYLGQGSTVTARDIFLGSCTFASGLPAEEQTTCAGRLPLPVTLTPGRYFAIAVADDRNETTMTDRTDAARASTSSVALAPAEGAPALSAAGIAHGATALAGSISPGQVVVIYGERLGPATLANLEVGANGRVTSSLAGTRVLFDGVPAPLIYTSSGQVSCVVPYAVAGLTSAAVRVEFNGRVSAAVNVPVAATAPGIFTLDFSGRGQGAIVNQNGTVNGAARPADRGSVVLIYATGGGSLSPAGIDGAVIGAPLPQLTQPVEVIIGGQVAQLLYAGPAPGIVSGVVQINAVVPMGATPAAAAPVGLRIGSVSAPPGVTMAIR